MDTSTYLKVAKIGADISPYLALVHQVTSMLRVPTQGAHTIALVVIVRSLLSGQRQSPERLLQNRTRLHCKV